MKKRSFELLLFDLGGTLAENVGTAALAVWGRTTQSTEVIIDQWLMSSTVRRFESGRMPAVDFASAIIRELALPVTPEKFLDEFAGWVKGFYPGVLELLHRLSTEYKLGCLSNTNIIHWQRGCAAMSLDTLFDYCFLSHETGLLKPDPEAYHHVIRQTGCRPENIVFLDDSQRNVNSAKTTGMIAFQAIEMEGVFKVLRDLEII